MMINFRKGKVSDLERAFQIKSDAEFEFVEKYFGWDASFQMALHQQEWRKTRPTIVEYQGNRVGFFSIESEGEKEFFRRFFISDDYRNRRIGSAVIRRLISEYKIANRELWLAVFKGNPARNLYIRHGFKLMDTTDKYEYLCWSPEKRG